MGEIQRNRNGVITVAIFILAATFDTVCSSPALPNNNGIQKDNMTLEVDYEQLMELLRNDSSNFILDVREPEEIKENGAILGSVNVPLKTLESLSHDAKALLAAIEQPVHPSGHNVILSCRSGRRAFLARDIFTKLGFNEVKVYPGSFVDWSHKGGKILMGE